MPMSLSFSANAAAPISRALLLLLWQQRTQHTIVQLSVSHRCQTQSKDQVTTNVSVRSAAADTLTDCDTELTFRSDTQCCVPSLLH
jgi:hypothetical protein